MAAAVYIIHMKRKKQKATDGGPVVCTIFIKGDFSCQDLA